MAKQKENKRQSVGIVTVGDKGQVVIPVTIRNMFGIKSGDQLVFLADLDKGIAIVKADEAYSSFNQMAETKK